MAWFSRGVLTLLLLGLCQLAGAAPSPGRPFGKLAVGSEKVVPAKMKARPRSLAQADNGISLAFMCNENSEESYTNYSGLYLGDNYIWSWSSNPSVTYEADKTILRYNEENNLFYFRVMEGGAPLEAIKVYLDTSRDNNAELICAYADFEAGSLYYSESEFITDYDNGVIYWKPETTYGHDNIVFYVSAGEINVIGFEIYSQGNTPADFMSALPAPLVAAPVFRPASCEFSKSLAVEILAEEGNTVYWQTGGVPPTVDEDCKYSGPIVISASTTIKALAVDADGNKSNIATAKYTSTRHGIGEGYDPDSPGNPGSETAEKKYHITVAVNPSGAGSASVNSSDLKAGEQTYVYTYNSGGFVFKNWTIEGEVVSTNTSFYYVMPEHDVTLIANYEFNPASPGNPSPEEQKVKHPVVVRALPVSSAASLSPSGVFDMEEGESRSIYAYPSTGWKFLGWTVNGETQAQTSSPLAVTMGEKALDIAAYFSYEPSSPSNPGANYYNPSTGQVIMDDFAAGSLYTSLGALVGRDNFSNISSLIVKGKITANDLGTLSYCTNAATIDLSRTGGLTSISSYAFENLAVADLVLPSGITSIGSYAFSGCSNLASLTVYAQEPPACSYNTFSSFTNKANCTVYVPASAIDLYTAANYWKDFTILPITNDAHVLQVNLPADASDGRYKNNSVEIVNINSGVRQKYVISDRLLYTFNGLRKDEQYNVYMFSQAGLEIGRIENVVIPDRDIEVTFDNLKSLHTVFAKVLAADGSDVTSQVSVEWFKPLADGTSTYLRKAVSLGEIPAGQKLVCRVTLDSKLGTVYSAPEDVEFTVGEGNNTCSVSLSPFRTVELSGSVVDGGGSALSGAAVSINQTLNGKFSKTYTAKTDRKGAWIATVLDAPETRIVYAASECVNVNDTIGAFDPAISAVDLGKTVLKSIVGARVTYGFTYKAAGAEDAESYYSDYQNVAISVFNQTQGRAHGQLSLQYPLLAVLDEAINPGDVLKLTATSKTGAFNPIVKTVTVGDDQRAEVTFDIVGKGGIAASFEMTENPAVNAMLYSANGELLKKTAYSEAKVKFTDLADGAYTLVSMGHSELMNSVLRLDNFSEIGLTEGKDYVKNTVTVESGQLAEVKIPEVPAFDESLFYYTNSSTSFSANKSSITTGGYLTLRSAIDFKGVYKSDISNVSLVVDLPESCDLVEQSVIQGPNLLPYTFENKRLTVPLGNNYQSQTRFCVVPTNGGSFNATASIVFDYNGKTLTQPIGNAVSEIKDIEISVPKIVASKEFVVTGSAQPKSDVEVYSGSTIIGRCQTNAKGIWNANCVLIDPTKLSTINVFAKITTPAHIELLTEDKEILYDPEAIMPTTVTMTFWNGWYKKQYEVVWDLSEGTCNATKYDFYTTTDLTFLVKFTSTDPDKLRNIVLNVFTSSGKVTKLVPVYSDEHKCWVAVSNFSSSSLPINVSVDYELNEASQFDSDFLATNLNPSIGISGEFEDNQSWLSSTVESLTSANTDVEEEGVIEEICQRYGVDIDEDNVARTEESIASKLSQTTEDFDYLSNLLSASPLGEAVEDYVEGIEVHNCDNLTADRLLELGFSTIKKTDGNCSFYLNDGATWQFVDFESNIYLVVDCQSNSPIAKIMRANSSDTAEGWIVKLQEVSQTIKDLVEGIYGFLNSCNENLDKATAAAKAELADLEQDRRWLQKNSNNVWLKGEIKLKIAAKTKVLEGLESTKKWLNKNFKQYMSGSSTASKIAGKAFSFTALILDGVDAVNEVRALIAFRDSLTPPCPEAESAVQKLKDSANRWATGAGAYYFAKLCCDVAEIGGVTAGIAALVPSGGTSTSAILASIAVMAANIAADYAYTKLIEGFKDRTEKAYKKTQKLCKEEDPDPEDFPDDDDPTPNDNSDTDPDHYPEPTEPITNPVDPIHDPAGFVYEAVPTNRVEGVQASIYYKETKEDMYGDPYEEIILWNAEEYAQKNPLFTDENGMYRWDVPQGLWQVKFEKDGYQTAFSEWLPVPPPQLEVNIGIVQNKQPEVTEARAYEEGVEVQFDKYMDLSTMTTENIFVTAGGEKLNGEIRLIDAALADEYASEEDADATRYASRVRFVPEQPLSVTTGEIRLTVSRNVLSYAGIPMTETFSQALDVEKEVQAITADDVKVLYGGEKEITVYALPYDAAVGRTLRIANSSDLIISVDTAEALLDDEGKAVVKVKGDLPGRAQLTFSIDDVTAKGECAVDVVTEIITAEAPKSSRASGTAVYRGTKVELTTESKNATIFFTTDGSCPCDENGTRRKYTVPIVINDDTQILAMTSVGNGDDDVSETVQFNYSLKRSDMDFQMEEGWTWISHNFEEAVAPAEIAADESVSRILSQTREVIRDPQMGMVGTLSELSPTESYKVETAAATARHRLSDVAWNPATPIALTAGWNWLGYPVGQTMSVDEAFAPTEAETLDIVVGQNGFAQFDGEHWVGTLETMSPGMGYMYQSQSPKNVVYNTSIVSTASAKSAAGISGNSKLALDIHKYATIMPVVATLRNIDGAPLDNEDYRVAAFCGTECRGIGRVVRGLVMMTVYGNPDDNISFRVTDFDEELEFGNDASLKFSERVVGDILNPYAVTVNDRSGIAEVSYDGNVKVSVEGDMLSVKGIAPGDIDLVEVYDTDGRKVIRETRVSESGIRISTLTDGVYVVVVSGNGEYTYHKIAIR